MTAKSRPIPMHRLLERVSRELEMSATVFCVSPGLRGDARLPLGVAAGPSTRMAQNLASGYVAGARSFELAVPGPEAGEEALAETLDEAVKGNVLTQLLGWELGLGQKPGGVFIMNVSGDREWLAGEEMTAFFDAMRDASLEPIWQECCQAAQLSLRRFNNLDRGDLEELDPHISKTAVLDWTGSPETLEDAALYLMEERGLHTYIHLDPTALGPIGMHACLEAQGGEDTPLDAERFGPGLEWFGPVLDRLRQRAEELGLTLGVRVGGAVPLADGRALTGPAAAPLQLLLAARVAARWPGMPIAWAGETDYFNIGELCRLDFRCVAVGAELLAPGGYLRLRQLAKLASAAVRTDGVNAREAENRARAWSRQERCRLDKSEPARVRIPGKAPLTDCFTAPCQQGCPFGMDLAGALRLMSDGRYRDALRVILDKNPLPHLTGALCAQPCQGSCTRIFYDQPIAGREAEGLCAQRAWGDLLARLEPETPEKARRVAILGGSVGGMAVAFLLARRGAAVTLFETAGELCPLLRREERSLAEAVELDAQALEVLKVDLRLNTYAPSPRELLEQGYETVILAPEGLRYPESDSQLRLFEQKTAQSPEEEPPQGVLTLPTRCEAEGGIARIIADAHALVNALLGPAPDYPHPAGRRGGAMGKKGKVCPVGAGVEECERCLECATVCECCVDVCPNRANVPIVVPTRAAPQILHLDAQCDHCGVCGRYCPYESDPSVDKFTLYETAEDFAVGRQEGFVVLDFLARKVRLRLGGQVRDLSLKDPGREVPDQIRELLETVFIDYPHLLDAQRSRETDQVSLWEE